MLLITLYITVLFVMTQSDGLQNDKLGEERDAGVNVGQTAKCGKGMNAAGICGRPIHSAPTGADEKPVCLMHSQDPNKTAPGLTKRFQQEIESILRAAGTGVADFSQFVFPGASFCGQTFDA